MLRKSCIQFRQVHNDFINMSILYELDVDTYTYVPKYVYLVFTKLSKAFYCECRHIIKEWIHRAYIFDSIWYVNVRIPGELFY